GRPPGVGVDELALRRMLAEIAQEGAGLGDGPAFDAAGVAGQIERQPAGGRVLADQALAHRRPFDAFVVREVVATQNAARKERGLCPGKIGLWLRMGPRASRLVFSSSAS